MTDQDAEDAGQLPVLPEDVDGEIASVTADGAYDGEQEPGAAVAPGERGINDGYQLGGAVHRKRALAVVDDGPDQEAAHRCQRCRAPLDARGEPGGTCRLVGLRADDRAQEPRAVRLAGEQLQLAAHARRPVPGGEPPMVRRVARQGEQGVAGDQLGIARSRRAEWDGSDNRQQRR